MRFVPISCVREGMILANDLYNRAEDFLLAAGSALTEPTIASIRRLAYKGIYIEDEISKGIHITNIISDRTRTSTSRKIKEIFLQTKDEGEISRDNLEMAKRQVDTIVGEIVSNDHLLLNLADLKTYDDYTYDHSVNVAILSIALGVGMGLSKVDLCSLGFSALLHDIGKVFVNKEILNKNGKLTEDEFNEIQKHSSLGYEYIKKSNMVSDEILTGILEHHEKYGGGGYPNNKKGPVISLFGRIISVSDVYDALTSERPYRKAVLPSDATEYLMASVDTQFDPVLIDIFVRTIAPYPVGTCVNLSSGSTAIVTENNKEMCLRPSVRIFKHLNKDVIPYDIRLSDHKYFNITITGIAD